MKSYMLEGTVSREAAVELLCRLFPGQRQPWRFANKDGDTIAHVYVAAESNEGDLSAPAVVADVGERSHESDRQIESLFRVLQAILGGCISNPP